MQTIIYYCQMSKQNTLTKDQKKAAKLRAYSAILLELAEALEQESIPLPDGKAERERFLDQELNAIKHRAA